MPPTQPHETIWTLTNAVVPSTCLHVIAELGVADHIGDVPADKSKLASRCGVDADALGRVLRLLCDHGVFEQADGGFRHNPASDNVAAERRSGFQRCAAAHLGSGTPLLSFRRTMSSVWSASAEGTLALSFRPLMRTL